MAVDDHRLITRRAEVARLDAGELPHHPVGALNEALAGGIDIGSFLQDLQGFAEEPFAGIFAAIAAYPLLAARDAGGVDLVGLGLGSVVFPQLDPGVGMPAPRCGEA